MNYVSIDGAVELQRLVLLLGRVERATRDVDGCPESVTTHTAMLALLAAIWAERSGGDAARAMRFALVHDLVECYAGDVSTLGGLDEDDQQKKDSAEREAAGRIAVEIGDELPEVLEWILAYERQEEDEARLVRVLDKALPKIVATLDGGSFVRAQDPSLELQDLRRMNASQVLELESKYPDQEDALSFLVESRDSCESAWRSTETVGDIRAISDALEIMVIDAESLCDTSWAGFDRFRDNPGREDAAREALAGMSVDPWVPRGRRVVGYVTVPIPEVEE